MSEHLCPYCNRLYRIPQGQGNRKCCFKEKCIVKHRAAQRDRDKARHREYNREWRNTRSFKLEVKKDPRQGQKLIFCPKCHKWELSYFEPYCLECRDELRREIDTDWIYYAEDRWKGIEA